MLLLDAKAGDKKLIANLGMEVVVRVISIENGRVLLGVGNLTEVQKFFYKTVSEKVQP